MEPASLKIVLMNCSLAKSEQRVSEVLEELNASQTREGAVSEARKIDQAIFGEATKRLESRVSSLEAELERSRESCVAWSILVLDMLIFLQGYPSKHAFAGMNFERYYAEIKSSRLPDGGIGIAGPIR